jgi:hypothetical protein
MGSHGLIIDTEGQFCGDFGGEIKLLDKIIIECKHADGYNSLFGH